jgi:asparagine synthase (glutamine-hydrolysing)
MCGICGVYGRAQADPAMVRAMADTLLHRGPDSAGCFTEGGVGLGVRRLSIIDLEGGDQPIHNEDGSVVVVQNGEIYNYRELRGTLKAQGHVFRTQSDTEVLVHLYEEMGGDFPTALEGMFAVALYDRARRLLLLARDRMGKKPLYYARTPQGLLFGSEAKPLLLADPALRRVLPEAVRLFFRYGFVPEPRTIYPNVYKLPPASVLSYDGHDTTIRSYWDLVIRPEKPRPRQEYLEELDVLFEGAVRRRLTSEVPLGAFLSGGPDSSLIVATMSRVRREPVETFTIAYREDGFDESSAAARVARCCHTRHHVKLMTQEELRGSFFADVERIVRHTDEPVGDSSALPTYHLCRLAREGVKVILGGDGADEVFAGYTLFQGLRFARLYRRLPPALRRRMIQPLAEWLAACRPAGASRWAARSWCKRLTDSNLDLEEMLASKFSLTPSGEVDRLLLPSSDAPGAGNEIPLGSGVGIMDQAQYAVTRFQQVNDMLVKIDRMSMAHSLEMRSPFLDRQVVEFAARLPWRFKLKGWETKSLLRDLAARYVPAGNARKRKQGFGVPISLWFRGALETELRARLGESRAIREFARADEVTRVLEEHRRGLCDHGQLLWCLLTFDAWHRAYIEQA